jgi:opacity protein-like surface antigen
MKNKILVSLLCLLPMAANAAIPYRVEQTKSSANVESDNSDSNGNDNEAFARERRFYIGGAYDFSLWNDGTDSGAARKIKGKNTSSFEAMAGIRVYDTFRIEANYVATKAQWNEPASGQNLKLSGNTILVNVVFDARIDSLYRPFRRQMIVPYIGAGLGLSMNKADGAVIEHKNVTVAAASAGFGIEFSDRLFIDLGYRYMYMFAPKFDVFEDLNPIAHQFRGGVRFNF